MVLQRWTKDLWWGQASWQKPKCSPVVWVPLAWEVPLTCWAELLQTGPREERGEDSPEASAASLKGLKALQQLSCDMQCPVNGCKGDRARNGLLAHGQRLEQGSLDKSN